MNNQLLRHAINTVWCNPSQDRQFVFELAPITRRDGVRGYFSSQFERIPLPDSTGEWVVYQIGKVVPRNVNLPKVRWNWFRCDELAKERNLLTEIYTDTGIQFPRYDAHILLGHGYAFFIAVRINDQIANQKKHPLFLRFYSNAYYISPRSEGRRQLEILGKRLNTSSEILEFQRQVEAKANTFKGKALYFVNGRFVQNLSIVTVREGDFAEAVFDASFERVIEFPLKDLPSFTSVRDKSRKYLLHYSGTTQRIDYHDDIDVFLVKRQGDRFNGVYYHRNALEWMRMITHKDYSIPIERVHAFVRQYTVPAGRNGDLLRFNEYDWKGLDELSIILYIRNSGLERPLEANANRTDLLYLLPDKKVVEALLGLNATVPFWKAEALENSPYVKFMSASPDLVNPIFYGDRLRDSVGKETSEAFAGDVFGYHAAAKILADTPNLVKNYDGDMLAKLSPQHVEDSTVFEYNADGYLLGTRYHVIGEYYIPHYKDCAYIEAISGRGQKSLVEKLGNEPVSIPKGYNYRLYVSSVWRGVIKEDWIDVTDQASQYGTLDSYGDGRRVWNWNFTANDKIGLVRTDQAFVYQEIGLTIEDGLLEFSVNTDVQGVTTIMKAPVGVLDVWLNGKALQPGLDYVVHWPQVIISNHLYLDQSKPIQDVRYRAHSFPTTDMQLLPYNDVGFVSYGVLSNNDHFDLYRNKRIRVIVDGRLLTTEELSFDEDNSDAILNRVRNGAPYCIQTPPTIFRDVYSDDRKAREEDDVRDKLVSDYLTQILPKRQRNTVDMIPNRYTVISCFANKLLYDLKHDIRVPKGIDGHYSEHDIRTWLKPYEWIVAYDLTTQPVDLEHVAIIPHWYDGVVELDYFKYTFFVRALDAFLPKRPDISRFVKMS